MEVSVLGPHRCITLAAKYWQSVKEQAVFTDNLVHLAFDYQAKLSERDALLAEADLLDEEEATGTKRRLLDAQAQGKRVEAARCSYMLADMQLAARDRLREIREWSAIKAELVKVAEDAGHPFDTTDPNTDQLREFQIRFARDAETAKAALGTGVAELRNAQGLADGARMVGALANMVENESISCQSPPPLGVDFLGGSG
jgi:hypothetical protein